MKRSNIYKEIFGNISEAIVFNEKSNNLQVPVHPNTHYYVFAGGTKPYHAGHDMLVDRIIKDAIASPHADKAICLFIGLSSRQEGEDQLLVTGDQVQSVWSNIVEPKIQNASGDIPVYIEYGGGPVGKVMGMMNVANSGNAPGFKMFLYTDEEDVKKYYKTRKYSKKSMKANPDDPTQWTELASSPPNYYGNLRLAQRGETGDYDVAGSDIMFLGELEPDMLPRVTSGTTMRRSAQSGNLQGFIDGLPAFVRDNPELLQKYLDIMGLNDQSLNENKLIEIKRAEKGTSEYSTYLAEMMDELKYIKGDYQSRKKSTARYRKEAAKMQDAYSELRKLKRKNDKLLQSDENVPFDRTALKEWFRRLYK